jgi:uncharacterized protein YcfL
MTKALVISSLLSLTGCASKCLTIPSNTQKTEHDIGSGLSQQIGIQSPINHKKNGFLKSQVTFYNKTSDRQHIQYQYSWFNAQNIKLNSDVTWHPVELYSEGQITKTHIAPTKNATHYNITVCQKQ